MPSPRVGGEVDSFCTRCKMLLAHTVLAMVGERVARVRCNTCMGEHAFKAAPGAPKPRATRSASASTGTRAAPRTRAPAMSFDEQLAAANTEASRPYSVGETFKVDQVIDHPTFGRGIVGAARPDKIEVTFRNFVKTLVHGRSAKLGSAPQQAPAAPDPIHS